MRPKDCSYIVERLAIRFMALVAEHERQLSEHRNSFGARTEADAKIIARLRSEIVAARMAVLERDSLMSERNGLLTQVQDMRAEMQRLSAQLDSERAEIKRLQWENATMRKDAEDGYVKAIKVLGDPIALSATVKLAPKVGDTVRLVTHPERDRVAEHLRTALQWPWISRWGLVGQTGKVVKPRDAMAGTVAVALDDSTVFARWPIDFLEVVAETTHDTEAGKAVAEIAVSAEPVAEEIKVGDLGEVFQATTRTLNSDVGITGRVSSVHLDPCHGGFLVTFDPSTQSRRSAGMQAFGLCDVRKVTT